MRIDNRNFNTMLQANNRNQRSVKNFQQTMLNYRLTNVGKSIFTSRDEFSFANLQSGRLQNLEPTPDEYRRAIQQEKEHLLVTGSSTITSADSTVTKLAKLQIIADNADYTGMSSEEIYAAIWQRYNEAFDGNMPAIYTHIVGGWEWQVIGNQYASEFPNDFYHQEILEKTGVSFDDPKFSKIRAQYRFESASNFLGYAGMDNAEKEAAIIKKYSGGKTVLDFVNMQGEFIITGIIDAKIGSNSGDYVNAASDQLKYSIFGEDVWRFTIYQQDWNAVLFNEFDARSYYADLKGWINSATYSNFTFDIQGFLNRVVDELMNKLLEY